MSFHKYGFACQILGYYMIFVALQKLFEYKHTLNRVIFPLFAMALCSLYDASAVVLGTFFAINFPSVLTTLIDMLQIASSFVFHIYLLRGIGELASDTDLPKLNKTARLNLVVVTFYVLLSVAFSLISILAIVFSVQESNFLFKVANVLAPTTALSSIIYPISILFLLYSCYAQICAPEDIDMEPKPSRFSFLNKRQNQNTKNKK